MICSEAVSRCYTIRCRAIYCLEPHESVFHGWRKPQMKNAPPSHYPVIPYPTITGQVIESYSTSVFAIDRRSCEPILKLAPTSLISVVLFHYYTISPFAERAATWAKRVCNSFPPRVWHAQLLPWSINMLNPINPFFMVTRCVCVDAWSRASQNCDRHLLRNLYTFHDRSYRLKSPSILGDLCVCHPFASSNI